MQFLETLNPEQREAVLRIRGPLLILAGAGSGKTRVITSRIAYLIGDGHAEPHEVLAVTFTNKAADEMRARVETLLGSDCGRMWVSTFHSLCARLLRREAPGIGLSREFVIYDSSDQLTVVKQALKALNIDDSFVQPRAALARISHAKNRMEGPDALAANAGWNRKDEQIARVYAFYSKALQDSGALDFDDLLLKTVDLFEQSERVRAKYAEQFRFVMVDEYQDTNRPQYLLIRRLAEVHRNLCVVGDPDQSIYKWRGADLRNILDFEHDFSEAMVVRLERNYRSSPQVLTVANALARSMSGIRKELRATRSDGPSPTARWFPDADAEVEFVVEATRRLHARGTPLEEIAVLSRINARSEPFEEAFAAARVPYQVRDGAFLRRPGPRSVLGALRRTDGAAIEAVERVTDGLGFAPDAEPDGDEEATRQADLARMRSLAAEFQHAHPGGGVAAFVDELGRRFAPEESGRGVNLLTYHRSKGLEFDAVFLPRLLDGELPYRSKRGRADTDEERRLFYVGLTRARRELSLSWFRDGRTRPSPFLREIGVADASTATARARRSPEPASGGGLFGDLRSWRARRAKEDGVPAYVIFHDATLRAIAERRPRDWADLAGVSGVGPAKLERYADEVLEIVNAAG
jgi:DNA helicase-2/ATP-dependent DNA helicase PcrA